MGWRTNRACPGTHSLADISSGGLGLTLLKNREIRFQQNLHVGLVRMKEQFTRNERSSSHFERALNEYIHARLVAVAEELAKEDIVTLVLTGTESQSLFDMFAQAAGGMKSPPLRPNRWKNFTSGSTGSAKPNLDKLFKLDREEGETALPATALSPPADAAVRGPAGDYAPGSVH